MNKTPNNPQNNRNPQRLLEWLWLIMVVVCLGAAIHQTIQQGISKSYPFYGLSLVAFFMYLLRRHIGKLNR
jgi:hypothetical protein